MIMADNVKFISIPNYTGLRINAMFEFAKDYPRAMKALPVIEEWYHLHRQYLANVIFTTVGKPFTEWVDQHIEIRNKKVADEKNQMVNMDPAVAEAFRNSTSISSKYQHHVQTLL